MNCQSGQFGSHGLIEISVWLRLIAGGIAPTSFPRWEQPVFGSLDVMYRGKQPDLGQWLADLLNFSTETGRSFP